MALRLETYICCKCGKPFTKWVGGIVMSPAEMELTLHPKCDACKLATGKALLRKCTKRSH